MTPTKEPYGLAASGAVLTACVVYWFATGDQTRTIGRHLAVYAAAFVAYAAALAASRRIGPKLLVGALSLACLWRATLVATPPLLSDDVYRYVWEGRIQRHGGNPYAWDDRPESEKWSALRDDVWAALNHKEYTAIYPPAWQLAALAVSAVHDSVTAMKAFLVLCEFGGFVAVDALLRRRGLARGRLLAWAWNPLSLVEIAGSGHNEAFGLLWLCIALWALAVERPWVAALASAVGFQSKFLPGFVAAGWLRRFRWWHVLSAAALAAALAWPYGDAGAGMLMSLGKFSRFWRFNETLFAPLAWVAGSHELAVRIAAVATLAVALVAAFRRFEPERTALCVIAASLLLSPNVLPWYALWLLPILVVLDVPAAVVFTATVALAYAVYPRWLAGATWHVGWGLRALEYGPCLVVLIGSALRAGRARSAARL